MKRKDFVKQLGGGIASLVTTAGLLQSCTSHQGEKAEGPTVLRRKTYRWKLVTTWPPKFPILGEGCELFARWVEEASEGQLRIRVFGAGELVPAFEVFEAVSTGTAQMGSGASYYWAGKRPSLQFFASVPFGMNAQQMNAWLEEGGGMKLWKEVYADFNLIPFNAGNTGVQMGGWFNRKIESPEDWRGLKMRMPGLGAKVLEKVGAAAVLLAGGEIYTGLERGVIDATEWIGPYHDYHMGFHKIAKYYYYPGWHEPGTTLELTVNRQHYEKLPPHLQTILQLAAQKLALWTLNAFEARNAQYLQRIRSETSVEILPFPPQVLQTLRDKTREVLQELVDSDAESRKIYDHYRKFRKLAHAWAQRTEAPYHQYLSMD